MRMYKYLGRLRPDIVTMAGDETVDRADYAVSQNKPTEFSAPVKKLLRTAQPVWAERVDGVPLIFIWKLPAPATQNPAPEQSRPTAPQAPGAGGQKG